MIFPQRSGAEERPDARAADDLDRARRGDDDAVRALVARLSRAHPSGGHVIERAAIAASGTDLDAVVIWIAAHAGKPETTASASSTRGLHGSHMEATRAPRRYVLPAGALD
jgi:hypothetical protein